MLTGVAFWVLAVVAVTSGVTVFVVDSMARATYALALSFSEVIDLLFSSGDTTPMDCLIGSFDIKDGLIDPETLMFATPEVVIRGKGRIDLAEESLNLTFTPRPRERHCRSTLVFVRRSCPRGRTAAPWTRRPVRRRSGRPARDRTAIEARRARAS